MKFSRGHDLEKLGDMKIPIKNSDAHFIGLTSTLFVISYAYFSLHVFPGR